MATLRNQIGITVFYYRWVSVVYEWVQIRYARTRDTIVVAQFDVRCISKLVRKRYRRYDVEKFNPEITLAAIFEPHILYGSLSASSDAETKLTEIEQIQCVRRCDVLVMVDIVFVASASVVVDRVGNVVRLYSGI